MSIWQQTRQRALRRLWQQAVTLVGFPLLVGASVIGILGSFLGWFPAQLGLIVVPIVCAIGIGLYLRHLRNRVLTQPFSGELAAALDLRKQTSTDGAVQMAQFWQRLVQNQSADPWYGWMVCAFVLVIALNTWQYWGPFYGQLVGVPFSFERSTGQTLVNVESIEVFPSAYDPASAKGPIRHIGSDGFVRVPEGALMVWQIRANQPATEAIITMDGQQLTTKLDDTGRGQIQHRVERSFDYRFSLTRWGVVDIEKYRRHVSVNPDQPPTVRWIQPMVGPVDTNKLQHFEFEVADDRGVTDVVLEIATDQKAVLFPIESYSGEVTNPTRVTSVADPLYWPTADSVRVTLLAFDNDIWAGPNVGRSETLDLPYVDPDAEHDAWIQELVAFLSEQVAALGDLWAIDPKTPVRKRQQTQQASRFGDLANRAKRFAERVESGQIASIDAAYALRDIADFWTHVSQSYPQKATSVWGAQEGTWRTDQLIGREEAARIEQQQDQLLDRLTSMADQLDDLNDESIQRLLENLQSEMENLSDMMKTKRPQLPTEMLQQDALNPESPDEQMDLMQQLKDALKRGDKETAKSLLEQLIEQMKEARQQSGQSAQNWQAGQGGSPSALAESRKQLSGLQQRQEGLNRSMSGKPGQGPPNAQALGGQQQQLQQKLSEIQKSGAGSGVAKRNLERAQEHMQAAQEQLEAGDTDKAAELGWQASDELGEAVGKIDQQMQQQKAGKGWMNDGQTENNGEQDVDIQAKPESDRRQQVLNGFRKGFPEAGEDVNRQYFERLLH